MAKEVSEAEGLDLQAGGLESVIMDQRAIRPVTRGVSACKNGWADRLSAEMEDVGVVNRTSAEIIAGVFSTEYLED